MESDLANLESQIQLQQQGLETKEAALEKIRGQIAQVLPCCGFSFQN